MHILLALSILVCGIMIGAATGTIIGLMFAPALMLGDLSFIWQGASLPQLTGLIGKVSGGLGALLWCWAMIYRRKASRSLWRAAARGLLWGALASVTNSFFFALFMRLSTDKLSPIYNFFLNIIYGVIFWLILGAIGGILTAVISKRPTEKVGRLISKK